MATLDDRMVRWSDEDVDFQDFVDLRKRLSMLERLHYSNYEPTRYGFANFFDRLDDCLGRIDEDADAKVFLRLLAHVLFVSQQELEAFYRALYTSVVPRWLVDQAGLDLADPLLEQQLAELAKSTWFCPITDSMPIAHFYHVNGIGNVPDRAHFDTLAKFADFPKVAKTIEQLGIKRLVLLEDFVGSGSQIRPAIEFALNFEVEVLVAPALACRESIQTMHDLRTTSRSFNYHPLVVLNQELFIKPDPQPGEPEVFGDARTMLTKLAPLVASGSTDHEAHAFGFKKMGALVVLYSNCPNNSIAALRYGSATWTPIFPRARRE